jgi:hypothetical protein
MLASAENQPACNNVHVHDCFPISEFTGDRQLSSYVGSATQATDLRDSSLRLMQCFLAIEVRKRLCATPKERVIQRSWHMN